MFLRDLYGEVASGRWILQGEYHFFPTLTEENMSTGFSFSVVVVNMEILRPSHWGFLNGYKQDVFLWHGALNNHSSATSRLIQYLRKARLPFFMYFDTFSLTVNY